MYSMKLPQLFWVGLLVISSTSMGCFVLSFQNSRYHNYNSQQAPIPSKTPTTKCIMTLNAASGYAGRGDSESKKNKLLDEFKTASGEIVNPYQVLKVSREAGKDEIRDSYRSLSRRYHPDGARNKNILPGSCNNLGEVRDQWERIKLSYEILNDNKTRQRYDRHEMLSDPGAAMQRAAVDAVGKGIAGFGKGLFSVGAFAVKAVVDSAKKDEVEK